MSTTSTAFRNLVINGAVVMFIAFIFGGMIAGAAMGGVPGTKEDWVLAHMEALINAMVLLIVAGIIGKLTITEIKANIMAYSLIIMAYANSVFGLGRGATGSLGYVFDDSLANNITTFAGMVGVPAGIIAFGLILQAAWKTR